MIHMQFSNEHFCLSTSTMFILFQSEFAFVTDGRSIQAFAVKKSFSDCCNFTYMTLIQIKKHLYIFSKILISDNIFDNIKFTKPLA